MELTMEADPKLLELQHDLAVAVLRSQCHSVLVMSRGEANDLAIIVGNELKRPLNERYAGRLRGILSQLGEG